MSVETSVENPDASMRYGAVSTQVADIFEPPQATDSLVLLLHGGFWDDAEHRWWRDPSTTAWPAVTAALVSVTGALRAD